MTRLRRAARAVLMPMLAVAAIGALLGGVGLAFEIGDQAAERRQADRAAELESCERGNVLRQQIIDIGAATDEMMTTILDLSFATNDATPEQAAAIEEFRRRLDEPIAEFRATVAQIDLTDCSKAVPGAQEEP